MNGNSFTPNNEKNLKNQLHGYQSFETRNINENNQNLNSPQITTEQILYSKLPNTAKQTLAKAEELCKHNKIEEALSTLNSVLQGAPTLALIYSRIGIFLIRIKRFIEAIEFFSQAIHLEPNFTKTYYDRGYSFMVLKKFKEAEKDAKKCLLIDKNDLDALTLLCHVYLKMSNFQEAIMICQQILKRSPTVKSYLNFANVFIAQRNFKEAEKFANEALKLEPNNFIVLCMMGQILCNQEQYERAIESVNKVLSVDPNHFEAKSVFAHINKKLEIMIQANNEFFKSNQNYSLQNDMNNPNYQTFPNQLNLTSNKKPPGMLPGKPNGGNETSIEQFEMTPDLETRKAFQEHAKKTYLMNSLEQAQDSYTEQSLKYNQERDKILEGKLTKITQDLASKNPNRDSIIQQFSEIQKFQEASRQQDIQMKKFLNQPEQMLQEYPNFQQSLHQYDQTNNLLMQQQQLIQAHQQKSQAHKRFEQFAYQDDQMNNPFMQSQHMFQEYPQFQQYSQQGNPSMQMRMQMNYQGGSENMEEEQ